MNKNIFKIKNSESGVSLVIAFFIMIIILAIVVSIATLLYKEIKMIRNIGNSVVAFYAADSGIEKVMYYDRKIIPEMPEGEEAATRGLCAMVIDIINNPMACQPEGDQSPDIDPGLYCNQISGDIPFLQLVDQTDPTDTDGCDVNVCDNCKISFYTNRNDNGNYMKSYEVVATVTQNEQDSDFSNLRIGSTGFYKGLNRKIELDLTQIGLVTPVKIIDGSADPKAVEEGGAQQILIEAIVQSLTSSPTVTASISTSGGEVDNINLSCTPEGDNIYNCSAGWIGPVGAYYVTISAADTGGNTDELQLD